MAGVAAAAAALGVAEIVAVLTGPLSSPLLAVGGVVVDNVPAPVKDFGIAVFGKHDKTALITGTIVLLALYAAAVGIAARRSWRLAAAGVALFTAVGVVAALTRHDAGAAAALPSLVAGLAAMAALRYLVPLAAATEPPVAAHPSVTEPSATEPPVAEPSAAAHPSAARPSAARPSAARPSAARPSAGTRLAAAVRPSAAASWPLPDGSRRRFLIGTGLVAGAGIVGGFGGRFLTSRRAVTAAREAVVLPPPVQAAPSVPAGAQAPGASAYVTSNRDFYRIDTALYPPQVDPSTWELRIHGMVRNPITVTWAELLQRPMISRYVTLACVSNEVGGDLIGNALWLGTPIKALLDEAQPLPEADQVVSRSADGWTCGTPTSVLRDGRDALLAVGMNGQPLPVSHGFPVRMVVPGLYGYVSACKWITEIELTRFADFDAYWVPRGWSAQGPIKTQSRIDTPRDGSGRKAGPVTVAGVAWAQHRGIAKVEVQVDAGPWAEATLAPPVSADTWVQWSWQWQATPGKHTLRVRATDTTGETQTSTPTPTAPDGATGWHSTQVTIN
ncbi:molybdopterin-dependent oxidoreductase [Pseudosporangium ferrugineum]|uniref:molybdopterin-dependent oxidoreductase n=1 Tax=Pseudosporangium ferrugineum TaxID=439699 RepID=UPI001FEA7474|nr:molybdopterin-dependent oxidoreductase [Pseudosporangium ferrugineum]